MPKEYAHALAQSLQGVTDASTIDSHIDALVASLERSGKRPALPAVLREYERLVARKHIATPTLYVAHEREADGARKDLTEYLATHDIAIQASTNQKGDEEKKIVIDDTLVGGWRYIGKDILVDASHKAALLSLYRRITHA